MQDSSVVEASILFGSTVVLSKSNLKADGFDAYRPAADLRYGLVVVTKVDWNGNDNT